MPFLHDMPLNRPYFVNITINMYIMYILYIIYANICIMFYILWTNTLHFNKPKLLQVSGSTACMGAGPCACGTGAGN